MRGEHSAADRFGDVDRIGQVRDFVFGFRPREQLRVEAQRAEEVRWSAGRPLACWPGNLSANTPSRHRKMPMLGTLYLPSPPAMLRTSTVWAVPSKAVFRRSSGSPCRRSGAYQFVRCGWFTCCVVASNWKNSTTRACQPVKSRASCSSIAAVPLRRRKPMVWATSARALTTFGATPCNAR